MFGRDASPGRPLLDDYYATRSADPHPSASPRRKHLLVRALLATRSPRPPAAAARRRRRHRPRPSEPPFDVPHRRRQRVAVDVPFPEHGVEHSHDAVLSPRDHPAVIKRDGEHPQRRRRRRRRLGEVDLRQPRDGDRAVVPAGDDPAQRRAHPHAVHAVVVDPPRRHHRRRWEPRVVHVERPRGAAEREQPAVRVDAPRRLRPARVPRVPPRRRGDVGFGRRIADVPASDDPVRTRRVDDVAIDVAAAPSDAVRLRVAEAVGSIRANVGVELKGVGWS
ncbi:uncharacterized protein MICPUCDRAFT_61761 [Micromonas pusilla CCMP1545]|uniref:Predicted protein n=1 Tax=Micromonas pusilla (strain CCMP1545) TaxID=564608 RepID=C1MIY9_MICPC|nr:uncharacterized protein MICPUCDRAFT_61761 [Micromonas pusilla CCMP1545]EEH60995.1 predicted protein [Micromonas pusilla CCMP1545]|eukprot:XP_003055743.1 predicted protein [Micromonas pusilla CCMP1545]